MDQNLFQQLEAISTRANFAQASEELIGKWRQVDLDAFEAILRFMEMHPNVDFGIPGALVHYAEQLQGREYDQALIRSVRRSPTRHTAWMLHRLMNATDSEQERRKLFSVLEEATTNPKIDEGTLDFVRDLLADV